MLNQDQINQVIQILLTIQGHDDTTTDIHGLAGDALDILDPLDQD